MQQIKLGRKNNFHQNCIHVIFLQQFFLISNISH
jgi:hypothetical protein